MIFKQYLQVTKPGIIFGNLISVIGGFLLASKGSIDYPLFIYTLVGVSLVVASGCVFNNYIDRDIDRKMERTKNRVLVKGLISPAVSLVYATLLGIAGFMLLWFGANPLACWLGVMGFVVYVGVYSLYMKRHSVYGTLIGSLSGGQKKRVFLARAIAQQGKVILLDEPFTGVDVQTEARIIELLRELRDEGCTMLVSTHNLGSVSEFCDYTVMVKGTVLASGPTESTFTAENLELAFSGVLRHVVLSGAEERIITDDERPFISRRAAGGER